MQKKIIALAIAAAFSAPAFADATVYGIVDAAIANTSSSVANSKGHLTVISGALSTSRLGVKTVEDLDNGMKAVAVLEYKLDTANADGTLAARQEIVALAGGFGTVAAGYAQTTGYDWAVKFDPVAGSAVDALASVNSSFLIGTTAAAARAPHALAYISPDLGGVTVAYNRSFDVGNQGTSYEGKLTANLLSATYTAGPLAVGAVYAGLHAVGTSTDAGADTTDLAVGASYDLGAAKLFGTYQTNKSSATGAQTNNAMSFSAVAPVGPGALVASVAVSTVKVAATPAVAAVAAVPFALDTATGQITGNVASAAVAAVDAHDLKKDTITVAYLQGLSKTTTAYGALSLMGSKNGSADKVTTTVIAVGLKKTF